MSPAEAPTPSVRADSYLTLHYRVSLDARRAPSPASSRGDAGASGADVVSTFGTQPATLQLGAGQLSPALEECLLGLPVGAHQVFELAADEAFGPRNPTLVQQVPRKLLEAESDKTDYSPGDVVEFNAPGGGRYAGVFRAFDGEYATFDFNHPLAGQPVRFEVRIVSIL